MASPALLPLAVLVLISYFHNPEAVLLRARRQADGEDGPGSRMWESQCFRCSQELGQLVTPSDGPKLKDEAWVRSQCSKGEAAYQCLQSEACLHDPDREDIEVKIHENFCNNVEGVVALAVCLGDEGIEDLQRCSDYSWTQNNVTEDESEDWSCRSMQLNGECYNDKVAVCPQAARDLMAGEIAIFTEEMCQ